MSGNVLSSIYYLLLTYLSKVSLLKISIIMYANKRKYAMQNNFMLFIVFVLLIIESSEIFT